MPAAQAYEDLHVPSLFQQWADPVLNGAAVGPGDRVLDVACGTGVVARAALSRVDPGGSVIGVDPLPGMLAVAARLAPEADWRPGIAEDLPVEDQSVDAVVSQFGMMFFRDRAAAVREMLRVLRPAGRLAVAVWASLEESEAYPEEVALLERIAGPEAADALRAPFVMGDAAALATLFRDQGVAAVAVETITGRARFPSVRVMVEADLRGWLPVMGVHLGEDVIAEILEAAEAELAPWVTPGGQVEFDAPAHIVRGARPGRAA